MDDHRQGLASAGVPMDSVIDGTLKTGMFIGLCRGAYAAVHDTAGADGSALKRQWAEERRLTSTEVLDVVLVLTCYHITAGASQTSAHSAAAAQDGVGVLLCAQLLSVDIGGSTGGHTRTVLFDWTLPKLTE